MKRHVLRWSMAVAMAGSLAPQSARAQAPTIDTSPGTSPGAGNSLLGRSPGAGGGSFSNVPGSGEGILGGRPGSSTPRVPTSVSSPSAAGGLGDQQMGIAAP